MEEFEEQKEFQLEAEELEKQTHLKAFLGPTSQSAQKANPNPQKEVQIQNTKFPPKKNRPNFDPAPK